MREDKRARVSNSNEVKITLVVAGNETLATRIKAKGINRAVKLKYILRNRSDTLWLFPTINIKTRNTK